MSGAHQQLGSGVRFDWGLTGARTLAEPAGCLVVIDVLSFTTSVSIAVSRGITVFPYRWRDESAAVFAATNDATLAVGRTEATEGRPWSLSPASIASSPFAPRLVLPSPNGSTIAAEAEGLVVAASLRNGSAVARALVKAGYGSPEEPVTVIAAGERWVADDSLRPALEDQLGAGLVVAGLMQLGCVASVEAQAAAAIYRSVADPQSVIFDTASGRELIEAGFKADVELAAAVDADTVVPALNHGAFVDY